MQLVFINLARAKEIGSLQAQVQFREKEILEQQIAIQGMQRQVHDLQARCTGLEADKRALEEDKMALETERARWLVEKRQLQARQATTTNTTMRIVYL